jgi:hypothetical protein
MKHPWKAFGVSALLCLVTVGSASFSLADQRPAPACFPVPAGLVGWWPGNKNTKDVINRNDGTIVDGLTYAAGKVGKAFNFKNGGLGITMGVAIPASPALDVRTAVTIDAWIWPDFDLERGPIVEYVADTMYGDHGYEGPHFWIHPSSSTLYANFMDANGFDHIIYVDGVVELGKFQHVAASYDKTSGLGRLYLDGAMILEQYLGSFDLKTDLRLNIGLRETTAWGDQGSFNGLIDEVGIFNRALAPEEIEEIYRAEAWGKCDI